MSCHCRRQSRRLCGGDRGRALGSLGPAAGAHQVLGGMNANGTFGFDCATPQALSGIAEEVAARVREHYARSGSRTRCSRSVPTWSGKAMCSPSVWHRAGGGDARDCAIVTRAVPVGVVGRRRPHPSDVHWQQAMRPMGNIDPGTPSADTVPRAIVIDASYEGDVTAWSGAAVSAGPRRAEPRRAARRQDLHQQPGVLEGRHRCRIPSCRAAPAKATTPSWPSRVGCIAGCTRTSLLTPPHRLKQPPPGYDPSVYRWGPVATRPDGTPVYFNTLYVLVNGKFLLNRMVHGNNLVGPEPRLHPGSPARSQGAAPAVHRPGAGLPVLHPERRRHARARAGRTTSSRTTATCPTRSTFARGAASTAPAP